MRESGDAPLSALSSAAAPEHPADPAKPAPRAPDPLAAPAGATAVPRSRSARAAGHVDTVIRRVLQLIAIVSLVGELIVSLSNLVAREVFAQSIAWDIPVSNIALVLLGFVAGALAYDQRRDIRIDVLTQRFRPRVAGACDAATYWICGGLAGLIAWWALGDYRQANTAMIPGLSLGAGFLLLVLAGGMAAVVLVSACRLVAADRGEALLGVLPAAAGFGIVELLVAGIEGGWLSSDACLAVAGALALGMLLIGTPIAFSLALLPVVDVFIGQTPTSYLPTQLQAGLGGYVLLAIPFFVFAGYIMTDGGLGKSIIDLLSPVLRRAPGGLLQLAVGTMFVFSGMSGAKIADVAAVGSTLRKPLHDENYDPAEAAAVLSACAAAGETIPPSIAMLILGSITTVSIGTMFVAGIVPALVVGAAISLLIALRDRKQRDRTARVTGERMTWGRFAGGLPALGLPVILIGGIESGIVTPTESGAIAVAYALLVAMVRRHPLSARRLLAIVERSAAMSGMLLLLIAAANALASTFSLAEIPQRLAGWIASLGGSSWILILLTIVFLPIAGAFLEGIPAVLVFGPLLVPAAVAVGINGVHYSIVFILAMGIGAFSPLLGIGFYTACRIFEAPVGAAVRRYLPYFAAMIAAVCLIAFVPAIALWLPRLFGLPGA